MNPRVLLVEDDRDGRELLQREIAAAGYQCQTAESLPAARALLSKDRFYDLIVTDLVLGDDERGGLQVLRIARESGVHAPIIVITAFADIDRVKTALNSGASYLIEKPFRAAELVAVIRRLIDEVPGIDHIIDRALHQVALTDKETEVARLLLKGLTSIEIANVLSNSEKTIRQHVSQIYAKFGVHSRAEFFHQVFPS